MSRTERTDGGPAWGGPSVEQVRDAARRALASASPEGGRRAFALGDLTCVVSWEPEDRRGGGSGYLSVLIRLRRGARLREHSTTLPDVSLLARTCEHHLLFFTRGEEASEPERPSAGGARGASALSAADRLRALLHQDS